MADFLNTQSAAPATPAANTKIAAVEVTLAGNANLRIGPTVPVEITGVEGARTAVILGPVDTGLVSVPNNVTLQNADVIGDATAFRLDGLLIVNNGLAQVEVQAANGAGQNILPPQNLPARAELLRTYGERGLPLTGLKWRTNGASVVAIAWGRKAQ